MLIDHLYLFFEDMSIQVLSFKIKDSNHNEIFVPSFFFCVIGETFRAHEALLAETSDGQAALFCADAV